MELTKEEMEVLLKTLNYRIWQLEDCKLEDSYCYPKLVSVRIKLNKDARDRNIELDLDFTKK